MANSVRQVAANAKEAEMAVLQASQTVQEGDEAMNRTVEGIMGYSGNGSRNREESEASG
jgi:methyl-accepting chemotaxis protein PixJ